MIRYTLQEIKQKHKIICPDVSLEFFMEHFCKQIAFEQSKKVEVFVTREFSFYFT